MVARFWAACGLPDFRKLGRRAACALRRAAVAAICAARPSRRRLVRRARSPSSTTSQGDVETLPGRSRRSAAGPISPAPRLGAGARRNGRARPRGRGAAVRRAARSADPALRRPAHHGADEDASARMPALLRVVLGDEGEVMVEDEPIGRLEGFRFIVDAERGMRRPQAAARRGRDGTCRDCWRSGPRRWWRDELGDAARSSDGAIAGDGAGRGAARRRARRQRARGSMLDTRLARSSRRTRAGWPRRSSAGSTTQLAPLAPLRALEEAARDPADRERVRALLLTLVDGARHRSRARAPGSRIVPQGRAPAAAPARRHDRRARPVRARAAQARGARWLLRGDRRATGAPLDARRWSAVIAGRAAAARGLSPRRQPGGAGRSGRGCSAPRMTRAQRPTGAAVRRSIRRWPPRWG